MEEKYFSSNSIVCTKLYMTYKETRRKYSKFVYIDFKITTFEVKRKVLLTLTLVLLVLCFTNVRELTQKFPNI